MTQPNQSDLERAKAMAEMLGMARVLTDKDDKLSDVYSFGDASACFMNGYKLIEISEIITANYTPNSEVAERERAARIDEIRRTRPHLTYPGMVYYGERMNELRSDETEEV